MLCHYSDQYFLVYWVENVCGMKYWNTLHFLVLSMCKMFLVDSIGVIFVFQLSHFHHPLTVLTPFSLSSVLSKALNLSASCSQRHGDRLSFSVQYQPSYFHRNGMW